MATATSAPAGTSAARAADGEETLKAAYRLRETGQEEGGGMSGEADQEGEGGFPASPPAVPRVPSFAWTLPSPSPRPPPPMHSSRPSMPYRTPRPPLSRAMSPSSYHVLVAWAACNPHLPRPPPAIPSPLQRTVALGVLELRLGERRSARRRPVHLPRERERVAAHEALSSSSSTHPGSRDRRTATTFPPGRRIATRDLNRNNLYVYPKQTFRASQQDTPAAQAAIARDGYGRSRRVWMRAIQTPLGSPQRP